MIDYINDLPLLEQKVEYRLLQLGKELHWQLEHGDGPDPKLVARINDISNALDLVMDLEMDLGHRQRALDHLRCWFMFEEIPMLHFLGLGQQAVPGGSGATGQLVSWNQLINIPDFSTNHGHLARQIGFYLEDGQKTDLQEYVTEINTRLTIVENNTLEFEVDGGFPDSNI